MKLSELLQALPQAELAGDARIPLRQVASDSRRVQPGDLFVAYPGVAVDARRFIPDAVANGAVAVVAEARDEAERRALAGSASVPFIFVPDAREALAFISAAWYGFPSRQLTVIGVTGTDGKTTTSSLICSILQTAGFETGLVSTVAAFIGEKAIDTGFHTTTPDAPELESYLAQMVAQGARYAVVESTSLGLAQKRLAAVEYDVAAVTNITHEHLNDHHNSFEEYRAAKRMLFERLLTSAHKPGVPKVSVLNRDDSSYDYLAAIRPDVQLSYAIDQPADLRASNIAHSPAGLSFDVQFSFDSPSPVHGGGLGRGLSGYGGGPGWGLSIESPLIGRYNVSNILAALAVTASQGIAPEAMQKGVRRVQAVPGRMERINRGQPFTVIVDFAHTPNALDNALRTARDLTGGRVTVVFGCAGLRDAQKRPMMGEIAGRLADTVVITAEDPRTESLDAILAQVAAGVERAGRREGQDYFKVPDRQEAIAFALGRAQPGDRVIITGKGHERSLCFGTTEYPWSDQEAVKKVLG